MARSVEGAEVGVSHDGLPGIASIHLPEPMRGTFAISLAGGYGFTESVLDEGDRHHRILGSLSASLQPLDWLAFFLRFDSRYDAHQHVENGTDTSFVTEPTIGTAAMLALAPSLGLGIGIDLAFTHRGPGFDPLPNAVSPSFLAEVSYRPVEPLALAFNGGYRLEKSGGALEDPDRLSRADRLALGISAFDRVVLAAGADWQLDPYELLGELGWQPLVGPGAPRAAEWPLDASIGARYRPAESWIQLELLVTIALSARPEVAVGQPLIPIEPRVTMLASIALVPFGASDVPPPPSDPIPVETPARLRGRVLSQREPVPGAAIAVIRGGEAVATASTADDGTFALGPLPPGPARVTVAHPGHADWSVDLSLADGERRALAVELVTLLPDGELRGTVLSYGGRGIRTRLVIEPSHLEVDTDEAGRFAIEIQPGTYQVVIDAPGFKGQRRQVEIQPKGVTYLNVDLQ